jgi:hypothetical protein
MVKLLITGFMHSGTTMLMHLVRAHPQVGWIEFEENFIEYDKPKEWLVMMAKKKVPSFNKEVWGEKIPWGWHRHEVNAKRVITFSKKWLKTFGKYARILHILRHPIDVALSGSGSNTPRKIVLDAIFSSVPDYINFLNDHPKRCTTIVYEELLYNPEIYLPKIFEFINVKTIKGAIDKVLNTEFGTFGKINPDRAYAHRKLGVETDIDYEEIIGKVNYKL